MRKKSTGPTADGGEVDRRRRGVRVTAAELERLADTSDWERVESLTDAEIDAARASDPDAAPELDEAFWRNAELLDPSHPKRPITIRVDADVLEFFRKGGPGYQSRMNAVLRAYTYARLQGLR